MAADAAALHGYSMPGMASAVAPRTGHRAENPAFGSAIFPNFALLHFAKLHNLSKRYLQFTKFIILFRSF